MVKLLGSLFLLLLIVGVVAYASGWVEFQSTDGTTTIEMKTGEMKEAADNAVEKGKELIDKAINKNSDDNYSPANDPDQQPESTVPTDPSESGSRKDENRL